MSWNENLKIGSWVNYQMFTLKFETFECNAVIQDLVSRKEWYLVDIILVVLQYIFPISIFYIFNELGKKWVATDTSVFHKCLCGLSISSSFQQLVEEY